jgi:hypothetical protein
MAPYTTRIAPSPTGMMHIGTARTAIFNWLVARATGGRFLLRMDDTDADRNMPEVAAAPGQPSVLLGSRRRGGRRLTATHTGSIQAVSLRQEAPRC